MRPPPSTARASGEILPKVTALSVLLVVFFAFMALDSFLLFYRSSPVVSSVAIRDADRLHDPLRLRPGQIDRQQSALEIGAQHLHSVREHEGALELARRDAAVEILTCLVVLLPPANDQLVFLQRHVELIARETSNRQRDAQAFRLPVVAGDPFDVVGRISVRALGHAVERTLDLVKPEQKWTG